MSLVIDLIDLVAKHKSGELRCPATALIMFYILYLNTFYSYFMLKLRKTATLKNLLLEPVDRFQQTWYVALVTLANHSSYKA